MAITVEFEYERNRDWQTLVANTVTIPPLNFLFGSQRGK